MKDRHQVGLGGLCKLVSWSRATWYYESKKDDSELIKQFERLMKIVPNRGFDNYYKRSRREGKRWSRSRMLRVYREMNLVQRPKKRKRIPESLRKPLYKPSAVNEVWSMDFMSDSLSDGRSFRVLNVIDDHNRECLLAKGSISFPSARVIRHLEELIEYYGRPQYIRTDNGPEFRSKEYEQWCEKKKITPVYAEPGKPMQNGYIERFNRTFREDNLDAYLFTSTTQLQIISDKWVEDYNQNHPHESLGDQSPTEYGKRKHRFEGLAPQSGENDLYPKN